MVVTIKCKLTFLSTTEPIATARMLFHFLVPIPPLRHKKSRKIHSKHRMFNDPEMVYLKFRLMATLLKISRGPTLMGSERGTQPKSQKPIF